MKLTTVISKPPIIIRPRGRLGNQMFQLMLASELSRKLGGAPIFGYSMPDWGLIGPRVPPPRFVPGEMFLISWHRFSHRNLISLLENKILHGVVIEGWGMRVEHYGPPQRYQKLFRSAEETPPISDREVLINVRAEDILSGWHPMYFPMSFSYYDKIISETGLSPVFMGQIGDDHYSLALKKRFKGARFLPRASVISDFQTIRNAHHIALSVSSFAWLAAWLSESAQSIHMPVAGLFYPHATGPDLLPATDQRYRFYKVPFPAAAERNQLDLVEWARRDQPVIELMSGVLPKMS